MKNFTLLLLLLLTFQLTQAQSSHLLVEKTLANYIEGSSYNKLELLESAFSSNATLYLTSKEGFKIFTPKQYVAFFKNSKAGVFNGRIGEVLSIDVVNDIATARVKIGIPTRKWVYVDLFLLKNTDKGWKIISKTATRIDDGKSK